MKKQPQAGTLRFSLSLLFGGNSYYIDWVNDLELILARKPRRIRIDLVGDGEIPPDFALLIRSLLQQRSPRTRLITRAHSTLKNGSVLVWLLGDERWIREDAAIFFRRADLPVESESVWQEGGSAAHAKADADPEEVNQARLLQLINEYLPVNELVGRVFHPGTLRQFGLVENAQMDAFLTAAFTRQKAEEKSPRRKAASKPVCVVPKNK
ncbi:MAG TPA: hypothetical protein VF607_04205 [Verrucomicrobiae bacterium]